jgi:hypothetical protein
MWNLCFVFHASSSLEAFEPVVRKCGRILKAAEVRVVSCGRDAGTWDSGLMVQLDSAYLSAPSAGHTTIPAVMEQLFEDLNSYSETSIPLDGFNSLELKLFPFYRMSSSLLELRHPLTISKSFRMRGLARPNRPRRSQYAQGR